MKILPKKSLGQNFLTDINIINKIIDIGDINKKDDILEVGPGTGNLTKEIINKKPSLVCLAARPPRRRRPKSRRKKAPGFGM